MSNVTSVPKISVVIPVIDRVDDIGELFAGYERGLGEFGCTYEVLFVVDGDNERTFTDLKALRESGKKFSIIRLAKRFGEATVLSVGLNQAKGEWILTLPAYHQVQPESLRTLFDELGTSDMLIARRWPRSGGPIEGWRRRTFHSLLRTLTGESYSDLGCNVRLFKREIAAEIQLYGDQHRFLPILANRQGFTVREVALPQSPNDRFRGRYRLRDYLHRLLDIVTLFFLVRFTKKPLRFFGMVGSFVSVFGGLVVLVVVIQRLFFGMALADRPALLLGSLLLVLGVQVFALGLIGELIIFAHASNMKEYKIAEIIEQQGS
jgi:glycosyltransferase involved in cell wall biosynthesis